MKIKKRVSQPVLDSAVAGEILSLVITGSTDTYVRAGNKVTHDHPLGPLFSTLNALSKGERKNPLFIAARGAAYVVCRSLSSGEPNHENRVHTGLEAYVRNNEALILNQLKTLGLSDDGIQAVISCFAHFQLRQAGISISE